MMKVMISEIKKPYLCLIKKQSTWLKRKLYQKTPSWLS